MTNGANPAAPDLVLISGRHAMLLRQGENGLRQMGGGGGGGPQAVEEGGH